MSNDDSPGPVSGHAPTAEQAISADRRGEATAGSGHAATLQAHAAPVSAHAATQPAHAPVSGHAATQPAHAPVSGHAATQPAHAAPVSGHAPTRPAHAPPTRAHSPLAAGAPSPRMAGAIAAPRHAPPHRAPAPHTGRRSAWLPVLALLFAAGFCVVAAVGGALIARPWETRTEAATAAHSEPESPTDPAFGVFDPRPQLDARGQCFELCSAEQRECVLRRAGDCEHRMNMCAAMCRSRER